MIKNYVKYEDEINNEYINKLKPYDEKLNILTIKDGKEVVKPVAENGRWPSKYKYIKNIYDLNSVLSNQEKLVISVSVDNLDPMSKSYLGINEENLFAIHTPDQTYSIGTKNYLVDYDFEFNGLSKDVVNSFEPVVALKNDNEETYSIKSVHTITSDIDERREDLKNWYDGISDLYYRTTNSEIAEKFADDIIEFTKVGPNKWLPTKLPIYMMDNYKK